MSEAGANDPAGTHDPAGTSGTQAAPPGLPGVAVKAEAAARHSWLQRVIGASRLDPGTYEEVAGDPAAVGQAAIVAALAAVARAVDFSATAPSSTVLIGAVSVFAFWPVGAVLLWAIGNWFGHPVRFSAMLRVVGFAMAPLVLVVVGVVPLEWLRVAVMLLATALFLGALVVGVRQVLRVAIGRAAFICFVAMMTLLLLLLILVYVQSRVPALA